MKRYDLELTATGPVMEERKEGAYVTFSEVEQLQAKVYALLEERNSTGIAISNAILSGIVPEQHPLRSRLELLANHHKRELMLAELLRRARRYVSPLSCPESEIRIVQSIVSSIDSVLAGNHDMNERILTCVYCGHEYPQDTPAHGSQVLTDHIKVCKAHPLRKAESDIALLRSALAGLIGVSSEPELRQMEGVMRSLPVPDADKAVSINAIHALLATIPNS